MIKKIKISLKLGLDPMVFLLLKSFYLGIRIPLRYLYLRPFFEIISTSPIAQKRLVSL